MRISAIITEGSITIYDPESGVPRAIPSAHPHYQEIRDAIEAGKNWNAIKDLVDLPRAITTYTNGRIAVTDGVLTFDGVEVNNALSARILSLISDKRETTAEPLIRFMENVNLNPSMRAVEGLYEWLEKSKLPITPDGCIIAWKIVRNDYRDIRTGNFDNRPGRVVEISRNRCDENPDRTCSEGLHFCSNEYLPHYGGFSGGNRIVVVKVHPRDVVAFPRDYNTSKGRACRYEVIGEVDPHRTGDIFAGVNVLRDFGTTDLFTEIEVGGTYLNRRGDVIEIVGRTDNGEFPFKDRDGLAYTKTGRYLGDDVELPEDLVKLA